MKPDREKELEKLMDDAGENKDLFNDLYGDLFGGNSIKPAGGSQSKPEKNVGTVIPDPSSEEAALKQATDALKEAREMLGDLTKDLLTMPGKNANASPKKPEKADKSVRGC